VLTPPNTVSPIILSKPIPSTISCGSAPSQSVKKYDSASFSSYDGNTDSFFMTLVSRISQDVRTATTTADIRELHQAVQSDEYTLDPTAIASQMLLFVEA